MQTPIAMIIVLLCGAYVVRSLFATFQGSPPKCGTGCGTCPSATSQGLRKPLVDLELPPKRD